MRGQTNLYRRIWGRKTGDSLRDILRHMRAGGEEVGKRHDFGLPFCRQRGQPVCNARLGQFQECRFDMPASKIRLRTDPFGQSPHLIVGCGTAAAVGDDEQAGPGWILV
jgi:hypothetical protein